MINMLKEPHFEVLLRLRQIPAGPVLEVIHWDNQGAAEVLRLVKQARRRGQVA